MFGYREMEERKGRDLEGWRIHCLNNQNGGKGFRVEGLEIQSLLNWKELEGKHSFFFRFFSLPF